MKTTENTIAVRDAMVPALPEQSFFQSLRDLGAFAFELHIARDGTFPFIILEDGSAPFSLENLDTLEKQLAAEKLSVCALILGTDFSGPTAEQDVIWAVNAIHAAQKLGASAVRLDPATAQRELTVETVRDNVVHCLNEVLAQTSATGVFIGLENHGFIANDPDFLDTIFEAVGDERLGLTLDTGNFYWSGLPLSKLYSLIKRFAPRVRHTHIKSICYPVEIREQQRPIGYEYGRYAISIDQGDIDFYRVLRILRDAGYKGALCIENETLHRFTPEESAEVLRAEVAILAETIAELNEAKALAA